MGTITESGLRKGFGSLASCGEFDESIGFLGENFSTLECAEIVGSTPLFYIVVCSHFIV